MRGRGWISRMARRWNTWFGRYLYAGRCGVGVLSALFLRRAVAELRGLGVEMIAAFEQEFVCQGMVEGRPGDPYSLSAFRRAGGFGGALVAALREAGLQPELFLAEFGTGQDRGLGRSGGAAAGGG